METITLSHIRYVARLKNVETGRCVNVYKGFSQTEGDYIHFYNTRHGDKQIVDLRNYRKV